MQDPYRPYLPGFREIERQITLSSRFVLIPVEVTGPDLARALGEWLSAEGHPTSIVEPIEDSEWESLAATLLQTKPAPRGAVMVIGSRTPPAGVGRGLQLLNQKRDSIRRALRCPLLWCGPPSFLGLTWERAPDFWSVRAVDRRLEPVNEVPEAPDLQRSGAPFAAASAATVERARVDRAAVEEMLASGDPVNAARLARGVIEEAIGKGLLREAGEIANRVLDALPAEEHVIRNDILLLRARVEQREGRTHGAAATIGGLLAGPALVQEQRARALLLLAEIHEGAGDLESAESAYRAALDITQSIGDLEIKAKVLIGLGRLALATGLSAETAIQRLEEAQRLAAQAGAWEIERKAVRALANAHTKLHDTRSAREVLQRFSKDRAVQEALEVSLIEPPPVTKVLRPEVPTVRVSFLAGAARAARAVARLQLERPGQAVFGTAWLIARNLAITACYVLAGSDGGVDGPPELGPDPRLDFDDDFDDAPLQSVAVQSIEAWSIAQDYIVVRTHDNARRWLPLAFPETKEGEQYVHLIFQPAGGPKRVELFNVVAAEKDARVLYTRELRTPGAGGAPVFDDDWNVVALHESWYKGSVPFRGRESTLMGGGVKMAAIAADLRARWPLLWNEIAAQQGLPLASEQGGDVDSA